MLRTIRLGASKKDRWSKMKALYWKTSLVVATDLFCFRQQVAAFTSFTSRHPQSSSARPNRVVSNDRDLRTVAKVVGGHGGNQWALVRNLYTSTVLRASDRDDKNALPQIIPTNGVPIYLYTDDVEAQALEQLKRLAESPLPVDHISAMPDVHWGKGVTIGSVFASDTYVSPLGVGVDIGCGMAAIPIHDLYKWDLSNHDKNRIQELLKERIPTGRHAHSKPLPGTKRVLEQIEAQVGPTNLLKNMLNAKDKRAQKQLGSLGGGNHFVEVTYEEKSGQVWVMLHSGSRGIGNQIATHYDRVAKQQLEKQGVDTNALDGLNYMEIESKEGQEYLTDMEFCQRYAFENRRAMKETMLDVLEEVTGRQADMGKAINIHHNYCVCEDCGNGRKLWVTRKGATSAKKGEMGIIPGSMGVGSYITRGLGNPKSWSSSSHGAGRRMSRTVAKAQISQEEFENSMKGIVCDTNPSVKDEAPQAYKDLTKVMKHQESLTEIVHHLLPLINVKGFGQAPPKKRRGKAQRRERLENKREGSRRASKVRRQESTPRN